MRARMIMGDVWVDIYTKDMFGGRGRRLGPGKRVPVSKRGSIVVGPKATVVLTDRRGMEIMKLPPKKLVPDVSQLKLKKPASHLRVAAATL